MSKLPVARLRSETQRRQCLNGGGTWCSMNSAARLGLITQRPKFTCWQSRRGSEADGRLEMATVQRHFPYTPTAPVRKGIYSQAVVVDRTVYVSGQLGLDVASGRLVEGGVQAQTKQALINMGEVLKAASCDYGNVVKTTVLLADINDFNGVNRVYETFFSSSFPARAAYQVPRGGLVEIEAVAVLGLLSDSRPVGHSTNKL